MRNGVGASSSCSEPGMEVGRMGMRGNMYWRGYNRLVRDNMDRERAFRSRECRIILRSDKNSIKFCVLKSQIQESIQV